MELDNKAVDQMMELEKLRDFKNTWRTQPKVWVLENIDQNFLICDKISREIKEIYQELKDAKKKCIGRRFT